MSATYRVSAKAFIFNQYGAVLLVKEDDDDWDLPGGGVDHGETPQQAMQRELWEELGIAVDVVGEPFKTINFYHEAKDTWVLWLVFRVVVEDEDSINLGENVSDVRFVNVDEIGHDCKERVVADLLMSSAT